MNHRDPLPGADSETNHRAREASRLLAWCADHPSTSDRAYALTRDLDALAVQWRTQSAAEQAHNRLHYYNVTGSILHDARTLAGLSPHPYPGMDY